MADNGAHKRKRDRTCIIIRERSLNYQCVRAG